MRYLIRCMGYYANSKRSRSLCSKSLWFATPIATPPDLSECRRWAHRLRRLRACLVSILRRLYSCRPYTRSWSSKINETEYDKVNGEYAHSEDRVFFDHVPRELGRCLLILILPWEKGGLSLHHPISTRKSFVRSPGDVNREFLLVIR